jgi:hypothetical protein
MNRLTRIANNIAVTLNKGGEYDALTKIRLTLTPSSRYAIHSAIPMLQS